MNTHEAVAELVGKAQASARRWYTVAALITVAIAFGSMTVLMVLTLALGLIGPKVAGLTGAGVTTAAVGTVVVATRGLVRRRLAAQRPQWLEDLARREGLSAAELGSFFTLDSW